MQTDMVKNSFMKYMHAVGYTRGLVFSADNRKKLIEEQK